MFRIMVLGMVALAACTPQPVDPERAARQCEEKARAAQGPTGQVSFGVNSESGTSAGLQIGLSSDYLAGRDPVQVYNDCVFDLTGSTPIRPPVLN